MMSCGEIQTWHDVRDLERRRGRRQSRGVQGWGQKRWVPEMAANSPVVSGRNTNLQLAKVSLRGNQENKRTVQHLLNPPHSIHSDVTWSYRAMQNGKRYSKLAKRIKE